MKKKFLRSVIIPLLIAIFLGFYGAKIVYGFYQVKESISEVSHNAYAIQYGVYTNADTLTKNFSDLDNYVVSMEDGKYYVYVGFTTEYSNLNKIRKMYDDLGIEVYVKEVYIDNLEFINGLQQFDILLDSVESKEDILSVNSAILSSYEELILGI
ncbi:MAG: hypothetical protein IJN90_07195 [Bacilli bacterium]|nr:hypothetical protein [Bacilli bacterium]